MGKQVRSKDFSPYFLSTKVLTTNPQNQLDKVLVQLFQRIYINFSEISYSTTSVTLTLTANPIERHERYSPYFSTRRCANGKLRASRCANGDRRHRLKCGYYQVTGLMRIWVLGSIGSVSPQSPIPNSVFSIIILYFVA